MLHHQLKPLAIIWLSAFLVASCGEGISEFKSSGNKIVGEDPTDTNSENLENEAQTTNENNEDTITGEDLITEVPPATLPDDLTNPTTPTNPDTPDDPNGPYSPAVISSVPVSTHPYYQSEPNEITIQATLRDFSDSHPDFQTFNTGLKTGMMAATLDAENKPVYIGAPNVIAQSVASHAQWYRDVPGVNMSFSQPMTLTRNNAGTYSYHNSSFFPLNNMGFGNEGRQHNYHFTLEMQTFFTYQGGEVFNFTGDDDVYVYIDRKLAVDLGGVHGAVSGNVNLDDLELEVGEDYQFNLFFAERHTTQSNFRITTSLQLNNNYDYTYQVVAVDPEGGPLSYEVVSPIANATISDTGLLTIPISGSSLGDHDIKIIVTNAHGVKAEQEFTLSIVEANS